MLESLLSVLGTAAVSGGLVYWFIVRKCSGRLAIVERDLIRFSDAMSQMADIQLRSYRKLTGTLGDVEERILELAVPGGDIQLPLERRHRVMSMASKGLGASDIARKLNMPRGEAELILNLRKYAGSAAQGTNLSGEQNGPI